MSRFSSQHEIKKHDQILKDKNLIDAEIYREDLKDAINKEYHRINVDSAKKKAVLQRMDYDNFHQMVLGADLKGMRPEEIAYVKFEKHERVINDVVVRERLAQKVDVLEGMFTNKENQIKEKQENTINVEDKLSDKEMAVKSKLKFFSIPEEDQENRVYLLRLIQNNITLSCFFSVNSIEPKHFSEILFTVLYMTQMDNKSELTPVISDILTNLTKLPNITKLKLFMKKEMKNALSSILDDEMLVDSYEAIKQLVK